MKEMAYDEIKAIGDKLLAMPRPGEYERNRQRHNFLLETFTGRTDEFCQFMGHMRVVLEKEKIRKADAIRIFDDIALAALHIGRDDGHDRAIRDYAGPEFQFLLGKRKRHDRQMADR